MPKIHWHHHLESAALPLGMFATLVMMQLLWKPLGLPPIETIIAFLKDMFAHYGLWALFISAVLEGTFVVSFYFPGSVVIFSAILLSGRTFPELMTIYAVCWLSFMVAAFINYAIGYYGLYRAFNALGAKRLIRTMQGYMENYGKLTYAVAAFHPNYIAVVEVCAGIARTPLVLNLLYAGLAMAVTGPILVFGSATFITYILSDSGNDTLFAFFIALFLLWALAILAKGIYTDLNLRLIPENRTPSTENR